MPASKREQAIVAARRERVLAKRAAGMTFAQIADDEGLSSPARAVEDVTRALKGRFSQRFTASSSALLELERLDVLERAAQTVMRNAAAKNANPKLVLAAIDRLTAISRRRATLLGLTGGESVAREQTGENDIERARRRRAERRRGQGW
jgi:hypothetical protein